MKKYQGIRQQHSAAPESLSRSSEDSDSEVEIDTGAAGRVQAIFHVCVFLASVARPCHEHRTCGGGKTLRASGTSNRRDVQLFGSD